MKKYYGNATPTILKRTQKRFAKLIKENPNEPPCVAAHTVQRIYPAISVFDAIVSYNHDRKDAVNFLTKYLAWYCKTPAKIIRILLKIPGLYRKVPTISTSMVKKFYGASAGFTCSFHAVNKNTAAFDMLVCPYMETAKKYGCPEIVPAFCKADDVCYGNMHKNLIWGRTKTLGFGDDCCDFRLTATTHSTGKLSTSNKSPKKHRNRTAQ